MVGDALAPCVIESSAAMALIIQAKEVVVFAGRDFDYLVTLSLRHIRKFRYISVFPYFPKMISAQQATRKNIFIQLGLGDEDGTDAALSQ